VSNVRLVARPDPHMVEVPLDLEAELSREFEGTALLASTGLARKVRLKAQRDQLKLSTAYRADQLLADIARAAMQATPKDLERVQAAARSFLRAVRERRQEGASLRIESNDRGRIEIAESMPQAPVRPRSQPPSLSAVPPPPPSPLEQRVAEAEARIARLLPATEIVARFEERIASAERRLAELESRPIVAIPDHVEGQRGTLRRATAVDAYADGLRRELQQSVSAVLAESEKATHLLDYAAGLALDAEKTLGEAAIARSDELRSASAQAMAREEGLRRMQEEADLYSGSDLPIAERLLSRFQQGKPFDPRPALESLAQALAAAPGPEEELTGWLSRAATLCGWTLIEPKANDPVSAEIHDAREPGETVRRMLVPGVRRADGSVVVRARVVAGAQADKRSEA
jgi:hypothetical protein